MNKQKSKKGFTLLEVIIVVIIVGVLMSLALPRFFSVVEQSRGAEALQNISAIRGSVVRCALRLGNYAMGCNVFANLDTEDPATAPNNHFTYNIATTSGSIFSITAMRNSKVNGNTSSGIWLQQHDGNATVLKGGNGPFQGI